jgi:hypothetical protein
MNGEGRRLNVNLWCDPACGSDATAGDRQRDRAIRLGDTIHASSAKAALSRRRVESYAAREGFRLEAP